MLQDTRFSASSTYVRLLYLPIKAKNMSHVMYWHSCDASSTTADVPKEEAWVQRPSTFPLMCRTGSWVPTYMSLEWEEDCINSFISLSVVLQKSTWTPREHGALQLTAKRCAVLHRVSQERRRQWSARLVAWRSAPLARRHGIRSACARKTKLVQYQLSRGKRGTRGDNMVFQFLLARGASSVPRISFMEQLLSTSQVHLWDFPSLLVFPKYNSSLNICLNDTFYFLILIINIIWVLTKLVIPLTFLKGEALSRALNLPKGSVRLLELWLVPIQKNPIHLYSGIQTLLILWLRNHPCLIFIESLHSQILTLTESGCKISHLVWEIWFMLILHRCKQPTDKVA